MSSPAIRAAVLSVLFALMATGCYSTGAAVEGASGAGRPLATSVSAGPGGGATPGGPPAPPPLATVPAGTDNLVSLAGTARSVETTASVAALSSIHLSGPSVLSGSGDVIDRNGRDLGPGTLRASGGDVVVAGTDLELSSRLRVQPMLVTINPNPSGLLSIGSPSGMSVAGTGLTFQPPLPAPSPTVAGAAVVSTTAPPALAVTGPVTFHGPDVQIGGGNLRWVDAPTDLEVAQAEADLSWAGSGAVTTACGPVRATYLGVRAQQLAVTLHRTPSDVDVNGTGLALQVYANGVPQVPVAARFDVLSTAARTGILQQRPAFTWTPRNLDNTYDMAILSIHPGNAAARGVHLGLLPMPAMFGGEPHALVGGDTAGLKGGDAIDSLVARHGDDKRSIGYDAPPGVVLILVIDGNFAPVTVSVTTT